jgi:hypothetical protein
MQLIKVSHLSARGSFFHTHEHFPDVPCPHLEKLSWFSVESSVLCATGTIGHSMRPLPCHWNGVPRHMTTFFGHVLCEFLSAFGVSHASFMLFVVCAIADGPIGCPKQWCSKVSHGCF